ncbi:MAG: response regulator [Hyphomicrobiaceae bacterium]
MAEDVTGRGSTFLARKSDAAKSQKGGWQISDVLIVEDENFDADRLRATLHIMFGYAIDVRRARTLGSALDCVIERQPELIFLDDYLKPSDNAAHTIPFLRRCGYAGPIIVVSGQVDRMRRAMLLKAGAVDVIHKDDLDSVRIAEALARASGAAPKAPPAKQPEGLRLPSDRSKSNPAGEGQE